MSRYTFRLRTRTNFDITYTNEMVVTDDMSWGAATELLVEVYSPYGQKVGEETIAPTGVATFNLPVDEDGNAVQGVYTVRWTPDVGDEVLDNAMLDYAPINASVNAYADGYTSRFFADDVTEMVGSVTRQWSVVPPDSMTPKTGSGSSVSYTPPIYSGEYEVNFGADYSIVSGDVEVEDATVYYEVVYVYHLQEPVVMGWVQSFLDEYTDNLSSNPKQASVQQPKATRITMLLYFYSKHVRYGEYREAYFVLEELRGILSPAGTPVEEEIEPFSEVTGTDHFHENKTTLDGFEVDEGDLKWNGTTIGSFTPDHTVKASSTDGSPGSLDAKIDSDTLEVVSDEIRVKHQYLIDRIDGASIKWDAVAKKIYTEPTGSGGGITYSPTRTYSQYEVVTAGTSGDLYYSQEDDNTGNNPVASGEWAKIPASALAHAQNTDYRFSNKYIDEDLSSASSGVLTVDWKTYNVLLLTQDDATDELEGLAPTTAKDVRESTLENHDVTIHVLADTGVTIKHNVGAGVQFNNRGYDLTFTTTSDWARYRYNAVSGKFDLIATSLPVLEDKMTGVIEHLEGSDNVYRRFPVAYDRDVRVAFPSEDKDLDNLKEGGDYYARWTDNYPSAFDSSGGLSTGVDGWVRVSAKFVSGTRYVVQQWLATGSSVNPGTDAFTPYAYARVFDGISWGAWVTSDVSLDHDEINNILGDGEWHLSEAQKNAAIRMANASQSGLLSAAKYSEFNSKLSKDDASVSVNSGWSSEKIQTELDKARERGLWGSVTGMQEDGTLDPGATPTEGDRYIILDISDLNTNFKGTYDNTTLWITGEGVGNNDIVEWDGDNFVVLFDASDTTIPVTVTVGLDINANTGHLWTYNDTLGEWVDRGEAGEHDNMDGVLPDPAVTGEASYHVNAAMRSLLEDLDVSASELNVLKDLATTQGALLYIDGGDIKVLPGFEYDDEALTVTTKVSFARISVDDLRLTSLLSATSDAPVLVLDGGRVKQRSITDLMRQAYDDLTIVTAEAVWDASLGLNRRLTADANFTLTFSNLTNGDSGDLVLTVTDPLDVTLNASPTVYESGEFVGLSAGRYHICFTYDGVGLDVNIESYGA